MRAKPHQVRKARSFLYSHHRHGFKISPKKFADSSSELGTGFRDLLSFISRLYARGQGESSFRKQDISHIAQAGGK